MSAPGVRRVRAVTAGILWTGALTTALTLGALVTLGSPGTAQAASSGDNYNQMTGFGTTASAVKVPWTQGLLNAQNQPITTAGSELSPNSDRQAFAANPASGGTSPLRFMYNDFKDLTVTVSQTQDISHQGITVSWTGGVQTPNPFQTQADFLQMMECYGDSSTGPSPEDCEFGSSNMLQKSLINSQSISSRGWEMCQAGSSPNAANPPAAFQNMDVAAGGCDPNEPGGQPGQPPAETPAHCDPQAAQQLAGCPQGWFYVPFVPVNDPTNPLYAANLTQDFNQFDSNEVQFASTNKSGDGQQEFDALTDTEAPWLGCGALEANNQPRGCWLVIVPRGEYDSNGFHVNTGLNAGNTSGNVAGSPLSASEWAQRIQVHLSYAPLQTACPLTAQSRFVEGTQVITRAMSSWQFALNQAAKCSRLFTFTSTPETQTTTDLTTVGGQTGMAFTTIPIGSEAARENLPPPTLPKILYAPVAVTALDFGFNVDLVTTGNLATPVNLTPRLVAKAVTQVYRNDLPDYVPGLTTKFPGPSWASKDPNPETILTDKAFLKINTALGTSAPAFGHSLAPLLVGDRSSDNQRVWQWVQSDAKTDSWLQGTADPSDPVAADPDYVKDNLGKAPASDSFSEDYSGTITCGQVSGTGPCTVDGTDKSGLTLTDENLLPVADSFDTSASTVLSAVDKSSPGNSFSPFSQAPDGSFGYWGSVGFEVPGQLFMWGLSDTPDTAAYGLIPADLCDPAGGNCVDPSTASVTKALDSATTDKQGLLQVNPAKVPAGGYPLVDVVYAAVPTNQSAAALNDYADLIQYAAGQGQKAGTTPGDLPPGYLPLTASLQAKAQAVVKQLRAVAHPSGQPGTQSGPGSNNPNSPGSGTTTGSGTSPGSGTTPGNGTTLGNGTSSALGTSATSSPSSPSGPVIGSPSAELSSGVTPRSNLGKVRWALIAVLIIGAGGALGGGLLRYGGWPNWLNRPSWLPRTRT